MSHELDLENAHKAAQTAQLLLQDLRALNRSKNPLLSLMSLHEIGRVAQLQNHLEAIAQALEDQSPPASIKRHSTRKSLPDKSCAEGL